MKVVLFCGGLGMRLREHSENLPKPMVHLGYRPIIWHVMRYYAHFGHRDFVLCLGYKADVIKNYFVHYNEWLSNDFILREGGQTVELINRDIEDWNITFVDTGIHSNIGERLMAVRPYVDDEEMFLANYSDGLTDLPLNDYIERFKQSGKIAGALCVQPSHSFHIVKFDSDESESISAIQHIGDSGAWINGGYFVLRPTIFEHMEPGDELVERPFQRLIAKEQLFGLRYNGFWKGMDTLKERQDLDELHVSGNAPWQVWSHELDHGHPPAPVTS